jgi:putative ABC transport system permease protein
LAPGVVSAAAINKLPLSGPNNLPTQQEGRPEHSIGGMEYRAITPDYFQTMRIPVLQGRGFEVTDSLLSTPVAIVSETVAQAWWKGKNPIGERVVVGEYRGRQFLEVLEPAREVVGVVGDVKNLAINEEAPTTVYVPASQLLRPLGTTAFVVRASGSLAVAALNADQRVLEVQAMSDIVARDVPARRSMRS